MKSLLHRHRRGFAAAARRVGSFSGYRAVYNGPPTEALPPLKAADIETEPPELTHLVGSYTLIGNLADSATVI